MPYTNWRKYSYEELEAQSEARRQSITRQVLGAVAIVGGIVAGSNSSSSAASAASTAAVIGGIYAFKAGLDQRAEIQTHTESLKQLGDSFQSEVQPMVVDVEGRTLQLKGSAEQQYTEWRQLLKELYENETGLPAAAGAVRRTARRRGDEALSRRTCLRMTLASGQVLAARYALLRRLGDGRTAEVWLARDRDDAHRPRPQGPATGVACGRTKSARASCVARDLQRDIDHPNVLRCTELHDGEIVFAVFANDAIADLSRQRGAAAQRLVPLLERLPPALAAVHAQGLVHRDLKSANVLLTDDGRPMLTDFGLAARIGDESAASGGSPFTSSPQQLAGCAPQVTDDIYSFGAMAYELLSGYPPFYPDADSALAATAPPALPVIRGAMPPAARATWCGAASRGSREQRPQSAAELRELLAAR